MKKSDASPTPQTPAAKAIAAFGSAKALADAVGRNVTRIHRWTYPKARGGTDGKIPGSAVHDVLDAARARGIRLSADDLIGSTSRRRAA